MNIILILLFLMIISALVAIETSNLLSSIISLGAVGFLLSITFLFLGAPDIAITQVVVEIVWLIILIRAAISRKVTTVSGDRAFLGLIFTVAMILVITAFGVRIFMEFPPFGEPVMDRVGDAASTAYLESGLPRTGAANIVTSILLDFRAYDTLGEATVLFCAIMGALVILRKKARKGIEEADEELE